LNTYSYIQLYAKFTKLQEKKNDLLYFFHNNNVIIMQKEKYINHLLKFIQSGTCTYTVMEYLKKELTQYNFHELSEDEEWHLTPGKYYVIRNDASCIAFEIGQNYQNSFNIITTHSDTPALQLKPQNEFYENGYLKLNISPYGGLLNYGWLDRPLSIAGKIILKKEHSFKAKIIDFQEPLLTIPSVAIHQNDKANSNLDLNTQIDLIPIIDFKEEKDCLRKLIHQKFQIPLKEIADYDLLIYNTETPTFVGKNKDILLSPRIDNLTSTFAGIQALLNVENTNNINLLCTFNSEEIGSLTKEGADSNFLLDTLKKIAASLKIDISTTLSNTFIISSDNTHAIHPNHANLSDNTDKVYLNQGVVISKEMVSTTDALSSSIFKHLCQLAKIPYQDFTSRNDIASGSTLAGISLRHVSVNSIDVGLAQLAMHSSLECIGKEDLYDLYLVFKQFYKTSFQKQRKSIKLTF